ncbi:MAG TPA: hypothetical protein VE197_09810, partial [Mycobacterium sp.]|nr:hypothetical protein [Mycobacterium sp.]
EIAHISSAKNGFPAVLILAVIGVALVYKMIRPTIDGGEPARKQAGLDPHSESRAPNRGWNIPSPQA